MNKPNAKHYGIIGSDSVIRAYSADETDAYIAHLQQRTEAAEASAKDWRNKAMTQCAKREVAESKLAELDKQEPVGYHRGEARSVFRVWPYADGDICVPVYSRPAPAIDLADMVPDEMTFENAVELCRERPGVIAKSFQEGANFTLSSILENIEESK